MFIVIKMFDQSIREVEIFNNFSSTSFDGICLFRNKERNKRYNTCRRFACCGSACVGLSLSNRTCTVCIADRRIGGVERCTEWRAYAHGGRKGDRNARARQLAQNRAGAARIGSFERIQSRRGPLEEGCASTPDCYRATVRRLIATGQDSRESVNLI